MEQRAISARVVRQGRTGHHGLEAGRHARLYLRGFFDSRTLQCRQPDAGAGSPLRRARRPAVGRALPEEPLGAGQRRGRLLLSAGRTRRQRQRTLAHGARPGGGRTDHGQPYRSAEEHAVADNRLSAYRGDRSEPASARGHAGPAGRLPGVGGGADRSGDARHGRGTGLARHRPGPADRPRAPPRQHELGIRPGNVSHGVACRSRRAAGRSRG